MPKRKDTKSVTLELEYKRVYENGVLGRVLIVARDITSRIQAEMAERNAREQQAVIGKLLSDKTGFAQFVDDCETLIANLSSEREPSAVKRIVHTLKGNTAVFGLTSVAEHCHHLETAIAEEQGLPTADAIADLAGLWRQRMQSIEGFLSGLGQESLEIETAEHERLIESLLHRKDYEELLSMVEVWTWYRASDRLARLRAQTEYVARRLGKEVNVVVEHNNLRVPKDYLSKFWPFLVHVTRNAVDHGIERSEDRIAQGKTPTGTVTLRTFSQKENFVVEIADDGMGINLPKLVEAARARRVAVADGATVIDLVCADGLSTRELVTDVSGRGIGMAAVRQACEAEGGSLRIISEAGKGATFQFLFRMPIVKTGILAERVVRRWSLVPPSAIGIELRGSQTLERALNLKSSDS
jgi:two-component system chemotaxis sensor kinase CheA